MPCSRCLKGGNGRFQSSHIGPDSLEKLLLGITLLRVEIALDHTRGCSAGLICMSFLPSPPFKHAFGCRVIRTAASHLLSSSRVQPSGFPVGSGSRGKSCSPPHSDQTTAPVTSAEKAAKKRRETLPGQLPSTPHRGKGDCP